MTICFAKSFLKSLASILHLFMGATFSYLLIKIAAFGTIKLAPLMAFPRSSITPTSFW